jgi:signal peptide peptidase SppA
LALEIPFIECGWLARLVDSIGLPEPDIYNAEHPIFQRIREALRPKAVVRDGVGIVAVNGALARRPDIYDMFMDGVEDTEVVGELLQETAEKKEVRALVLDIDSPGGLHTGGPELAHLVEQIDQQKPVLAHTGGLMASLAYMIGSHARRVSASESAMVGSIGAFIAFVDVSKRLEQMGIKIDVIRNKEGRYKAAGVWGTALSEDQRAHLQDRVEAVYRQFRGMVQAKRLRADSTAFQGQLMLGREAQANGLVDSVGTLGDAVATARALAA